MNRTAYLNFALFAGAAASLGASDVKPRPASSVAKANASRSVAALLDQGQTALRAEDYKAARDAFSDVLSVDARNAMALEGATVSYAGLNDLPHAKTHLEKLLSADGHPSKVVVIDGAAILVRGKNAMRAVKILMQYISSQATPDVEAMDALATALSQADDQARKASLFTTGVKFYLTNNPKLEATRPGMKRWGTTWLSEQEANRKNDEWNAALKAADAVSRQISSLNTDLTQAQNDLAARRNAARFQNGYNATIYVNQAIQRVANIQQQIQDKQGEYDKMLEGKERPPVPKTITVIAFTGGSRTQLASASDAAPTEPASSSAAVPAAPVTGDKSSSASDSSSAPDPAPASPPPAPAPSSDAAAPSEPEPGRYRISSYGAAFPVGPDLVITAAQVVRDATQIQVQITDGTPYKATVERISGDNGLALLRLSGARMNYLDIADRFAGGALTCVSFPTVNIFQPETSVITGSAVAPKGASWMVRLSHGPRLPGGPLVADGKVVGVELASRDSELDAIPAATLDEVRTLLGADAPSGGQASGDPASVTLQVSAVREK